MWMCAIRCRVRSAIAPRPGRRDDRVRVYNRDRNSPVRNTKVQTKSESLALSPPTCRSWRRRTCAKRRTTFDPPDPRNTHSRTLTRAKDPRRAVCCANQFADPGCARYTVCTVFRRDSVVAVSLLKRRSGVAHARTPASDAAGRRVIRPSSHIQHAGCSRAGRRSCRSRPAWHSTFWLRVQCLQGARALSSQLSHNSQ
jgi:hypothetical protein